MNMDLQGEQNVCYLEKRRGSAMIFLMGVVLGILILALLLADLIGIISYLSNFIHLKQYGWLVLRFFESYYVWIIAIAVI